MNESSAITKGSHHIGLTVSKLEESAIFLINILGWSEVRRDPSYPAIFVSDGTSMVTLWKAEFSTPNKFDKNLNIGLHHLALSVDSFEQLNIIHKKISEHGSKI